MTLQIIFFVLLCANAMFTLYYIGQAAHYRKTAKQYREIIDEQDRDYARSHDILVNRNKELSAALTDAESELQLLQSTHKDYENEMNDLLNDLNQELRNHQTKQYPWHF